MAVSDNDIELPIDAAATDYVMGLTIDGKVYNVRIIWSDRGSLTSGAWFFTLLDENADEDNPIISGAKLVLGAVIGARCRDPRRPAGIFYVSDLSGARAEATINDLGVRVKVYYRPLTSILNA